MASNSNSFRVGRVSAYQRGRVWYLCYYEHGQRRRPRIGQHDAGPEFLTFCRADMDLDGSVGIADIPPFVQQLLSGLDCP